ncbi:hypothetical protein J6590_012473 [Homalodisca vitripennis]|nr:hypothetical protein J6590_012473 [Homalodisca vitripennis]
MLLTTTDIKYSCRIVRVTLARQERDRERQGCDNGEVKNQKKLVRRKKAHSESMKDIPGTCPGLVKGQSENDYGHVTCCICTIQTFLELVLDLSRDSQRTTTDMSLAVYVLSRYSWNLSWTCQGTVRERLRTCHLLYMYYPDIPGTGPGHVKGQSENDYGHVTCCICTMQTFLELVLDLSRDSQRTTTDMSLAVSHTYDTSDGQYRKQCRVIVMSAYLVSRARYCDTVHTPYLRAQGTLSYPRLGSYFAAKIKQLLAPPHPHPPPQLSTSKCNSTLTAYKSPQSGRPPGPAEVGIFQIDHMKLYFFTDHIFLAWQLKTSWLSDGATMLGRVDVIRMLSSAPFHLPLSVVSEIIAVTEQPPGIWIQSPSEQIQNSRRRRSSKRTVYIVSDIRDTWTTNKCNPDEVMFSLSHLNYALDEAVSYVLALLFSSHFDH